MGKKDTDRGILWTKKNPFAINKGILRYYEYVFSISAKGHAPLGKCLS